MKIKSRSHILKYLLFRKFDKVCVLNRAEYKAAINKYKLADNQIILTNNFVDHDFSKKIILQPNGILFVGLICKRKNPNIILEYIEKEAHKFSEDKITLIGPIGESESEINYTKSFQSLINANCSTRNIRALGKLPQEEVKKHYQNNCYFILPSFIEGMPGVLLEAMAHGMLIIASDIAGINDVIIHNQNGLLFNPNDYNSFKRIMDYAYKLPLHKKNKMRLQAINTIQNKFTVKIMANFYKQLFLELE